MCLLSLLQNYFSLFSLLFVSNKLLLKKGEEKKNGKENLRRKNVKIKPFYISSVLAGF